MTCVAVIDYGIGNVQSVVNACIRVGSHVAVVNNADELKELNLTHIILPGVGAIGMAMTNLNERGLDKALNEMVLGGKLPFLGICVGMQILGDSGEEFGTHDTLGWIPGSVCSLKRSGESVRLPHVGWNTISADSDERLFSKIEDPHFYFVHSFTLECPDEFVVSTTTYHRPFISCVRRDNIVGVQFHPEKSSISGERFLMNFLGKKDYA